jgi:hypothetical protein
MANQPESAFLVDKICSNRHCFRKTERGYRQSINVPEPCYFCIRYGHESQCGHSLVPFFCPTCIASKDLNPQLYPRYWRTITTHQQEDLYANPNEVGQHAAHKKIL